MLPAEFRGAPVDVTQKDVVLALFGSSLSIAALLLVFLGFVLSTYLPLNERSNKPEVLLGRLRIVIYSILATALVGVALAAMALAWLLGWGLYDVLVGVFFVLLAALATVAVVTVSRLT